MKKKALISIVMVLAIVATLFMGVTFVQAETIRVTGAESANVIPSKISDFEGVTVGETPVNSGTYDKAEWGVFRPYTSDNNWSKATFTTDNYVIIPQVVADPDTASGHGHVLKLQPKANNASPRWAIRTQLYAEASKYPTAVEFIVKISVDIKKSDDNGAKLYFRKDAADTTTNLANSEVIKANNEWKTLTLEYTCTLAEITANNNEFYYNIYLVQVKAPTGPIYLDNVKATLTPVIEQEVTPEPTETPVITPEPTPEVQYKANVIPSKISDFEGVTVGETPVNSGTYDKAEWGIFRPYTSDNKWDKAVFTEANYVVIPQVVADPDTASGHGHVLKLQPKAYNASPRWAIRTQLYAEALKYTGVEEFVIKISLDIKKSDDNGAKLYFRKDSTVTTTNLANSEVLVANNEWKTLTLEYTCTLAELQAADEQYYNIYLVQVKAPTGPIYLDNVKATLTPVIEQEVTPEPTETPVVTAAPTETPVITPEPTPEVQYKANVIPSKISDFEGVTVGETPVNSGTYDKAEWGIFRPYTSDNKWDKAVFTTDNYVVIPQVVADPDTASGHGHVLKLQPKAYNASPRWAIRTQLYAEALKYTGVEEFVIKISLDIKKSDDNGAKLYFRKDSTVTTTNLANSEVIKANNEWKTLTLEYTCTLAELQAADEQYYNIYLVQVSAPTGPIYLDNVKASITPTQTNSNKLEGATLDLGSTLTINYYADLDEDHKDAVLNVTRNGATVTVMGVYDETYKMYKFAYTGINPQCMVDNVAATLVLGEEELAVYDKYSVKTYLKNMINSSAEKLGISEAKFNALKELANDTLIYGREAQKHAKYNLTELATDGIEIAENDALTTENAPTELNKAVNNTQEENKVVSATLNVSNTIKVAYRVKLTDKTLTVKVNGQEAELIATTKADEYLVYSSDIKATEFAKRFTLTLTKDSEVVSTVTYSVNDYIKYVAEKGESSSSYNITKAISYYSQSAVNYIKVD